MYPNGSHTFRAPMRTHSRAPRFLVFLATALTVAMSTAPSTARADTVLDVDFTNLQLVKRSCGSVGAGEPCVTPMPPSNISSSGGVYTYKNVAHIGGTAIDARVTISAISGATIVDLDGSSHPDRFEPNLSLGWYGGYADFRLEFFDGSGNPVSLVNFAATAVDIDGTGSSWGLREHVEIGGFSSYVVDQNTQLSVQQGSSGRARFVSSWRSSDGLEFNDASAVIARYTAPVQSLTVRVGADGSSSSRLYSVAIGNVLGTFTKPVEKLAPSVSVTSTSAAVTSRDIPVVVQFSEGVSGFIASDVVVTNGTVRNFVARSYTRYEFDVRATSEGPVTVLVPAAAARARSGAIDNIASNTLMVTYDKTAPFVSSLTAALQSEDRFLVSANFSEPVFDLNEDGIQVTGGTLVSGSLAGSDASYSFEVQVPPLAIATVALRSDAARDAAGNRSTASAPLSLPGAPVLSAPANQALLNASPSTIAGAAPSLATVVVTLDGVELAPVVADEAGLWSVDVPAQLAEGDHTVAAVSVLGLVTSATSASHTFEIDATPPKTTVVSAPDLLTNSRSATFTLDSDEPGATFECRLNSGDWEPCAVAALEPVAVVVSADGAHVFEARAVDAAGNRDPNPPSHFWSVDTIAPVPSIPFAPALVSPTANATFSLTVNELGATFECNLNGAGFVACLSAPEFTVSEGENTLQVRATDLAGNTTDAADYAEWSWTVDLTPPETTIESAPPAFTNSTVATFVFASDADVAFYECRSDEDGSDEDGWVVCGDGTAQPYELTDLQDGTYVLQVRAVDAAGNRDPSPAVHEWVVDTVPPETTIEDAPPEFSPSADATFVFASNEDDVRYECSLDDEEDAELWDDCDEAHEILALEDGAHVLRVRAIDQAGNADETPAVHEWVVDTAAPIVQIDKAPTLLTNSPDADFAFSASESNVVYECSVNGGAWEDCADTLHLTGLTDGPNTVAVRVTDEAGNVSDVVDYDWSIDTAAPTPRFVSTPNPVVASAGASFELEADEAPVGFECSLDGGEWIPCDSTPSVSGLADGPHVFAVRATDLAGNTSAPIDHSWVIDTTSPEIGFISTPDALVASTSATFEFDANESPVTWECLLDGDVDVDTWSACDSEHTITGLADGNHVLHVRATDPVGNVSDVIEHEWSVDTTPPNTTFTATPPSENMGTTVNGDGLASFSMESTEPGSTFECSLDGAPWAPCDDDVSLTGLSEGTHEFAARAIDLAGNVDPTPATFQWTVVPLDSDGDGLPDAIELAIGTDPFDADSDDDGVLDGDEPDYDQDTDGDGLINALDPDSDNDGLFDGTEMGITTPHADTDVSKGFFVADADPSTRTNPLAADTDGGGMIDGLEDLNRNGRVDEGESDPLDAEDDDLFRDLDGDTISDVVEGIGDTDGDGVPDFLDEDSDGDGISDSVEAGDDDPATAPIDTDGDGMPDYLDTDSDGDGVLDDVDNCRLVSNAGQEDWNDDGVGDACEDDRDGDGVKDVADNCPDVANADQKDTDGDGTGDVCDPDADGDGRRDGSGLSGGGCSSAGSSVPAWALLMLFALRGVRRRIR